MDLAPLVTSSVLTVIDNCGTQLVQEKEIFQTIVEQARFSQTGKKNTTTITDNTVKPLNSNEYLVPLPFRTSFTILSLSWAITRKLLCTKMKPSQFPAKGKRRGKERGRHGEERKQ